MEKTTDQKCQEERKSVHEVCAKKKKASSSCKRGWKGIAHGHEACAVKVRNTTDRRQDARGAETGFRAPCNEAAETNGVQHVSDLQPGADSECLRVPVEGRV